MASITFRCTDEEKSVWSELAKRDRRSLGDWVKRILEAHIVIRDDSFSVGGKMLRFDLTKTGMPPEAARSTLGEAVSTSPEKKSFLAKVTEEIQEASSKMKEERMAEYLNAPSACVHKPFKRRDGLTVCEKCGVRLEVQK